MRLVLLLPIVYLAAVIQTSLGEVMRIGRVEPNLLALTAIVWLLLAPSPRSFLLAGAIGLLEDLLAPGRLGLGLACFLLVGYALTSFCARFRPRHLLFRVGVVLVATSLLTLSEAVGNWMLGGPSAGQEAVLWRLLGGAVYTAGASVPVLMILGWFQTPDKGTADLFPRSQSSGAMP
jgi:rod shape-determining protein MreD